jgi:hypothetical protein
MLLATTTITESAQNSPKQPNFVKIYPKTTQNYPKLPNFVKTCPKTISLRNFEIPPKIEILFFI